MLSYILTHKNHVHDLQAMMLAANSRYPWQKIYNLDEFLIGLLGYYDQPDNYYFSENSAMFVFGNIININQIRMLLLVHDANAYECSVAELMYLLHQYLGEAGFSILEGSFSVIYYYNGQLKILNDIFGQMTCYYVCTSNQFWVTSELKNLLPNPQIDMSLAPYSKLVDMVKANTFTSAFRHISRVTPNNVLVCIPNKNSIVVEKYKIHEFRYQPDNKISFENHLDLIHKIFSESVENHLIDKNSIGVTLSAGVDSANVAYAVRQFCPNKIIHSYTIGSEKANEFKQAKIVADCIGSKHNEIILSKEEIESNFIRVMYDTETSSAVGVELMVQLDTILQHAAKQVSQLFIGSGPDCVYGGYFSPGRPLPEINPITYLWVSRMRPGGFTQFFPAQYGITLKSPFYSNKLFQLGLSMDPSYKLKDNHVKYIWRKYADIHTKLPKNIVWGEKIEMQVGGGINDVFSDLFGTVRSAHYTSYEYKNPYTYAIFRDLFENRVNVSDIDVKKIIESVNQGSS